MIRTHRLLFNTRVRLSTAGTEYIEYCRIGCMEDTGLHFFVNRIAQNGRL